MSSWRHLPAALLCLSIASGCAGRDRADTAAAAPPPAGEPARSEAPANPVPIEDARRAALARVPGQVIEEELEEEGDRWVYEFDIQPSDPAAAPMEVLVDALTGEVVLVEAD